MSQKKIVRTLRILYPLWFLFGIFSILYVPSVLLDLDNPIKTASNIANNTTLFRLGIASSLMTQLFFIIIPFFLYQFFKNFDKTTSLLMLILAIASVPITMYNETKKLMGLDLIDKPIELMEMLDIYYHGLGISTIFWGLWLFPLGWLVYNSDFFPKLIGISLFLGGLGYLISSFLDIAFPEFNQLNTILEIMTLGELIFIIWFVIKGVNYNNTKRR